MNKTKTILSAMLLGTAFSVAQAQKGFHIGVSTAINSTYLIDQQYSDDPKYDVQNFSTSLKGSPIGFTVGYNFKDNLGLQLEANQLRAGQKYDILLDGAGSEVIGQEIWQLNYTAVPLLLKVNSGEGPVRFNFLIGPQLAFLRSGNVYQTDPDGDFPSDFVTHEPEDMDFNGKTYSVGLRKTDFQVAMGLGINIFIIETLYINFDVRLAYGFIDVKNKGWVQYDKDLQAYYKKTNGKLELGQKYGATHNAVAGLQLGVHYVIPTK